MPSLPPGPWPSLVLAVLLWLANAVFASPPDLISTLLLAAVSLLPCLLGVGTGRALGLRLRLGAAAQGLVAAGGLAALLGLGALAEALVPMALEGGESSLAPLVLGALAPALACGALGVVVAAREPRP